MAETFAQDFVFGGMSFTMPMLSLKTHSAFETRRLARRLARSLDPNDCLALFGGFGSGKTTFVRGLAEGLGVKRLKDVASPSFVILKIYPGPKVLYHFDLYRLKGCREALDAGLEEFMSADGVAAIEWAEVARASLPRERLDIRFSVVGKGERRLAFSALAGKRWKRWRAALAGRTS